MMKRFGLYFALVGLGIGVTRAQMVFEDTELEITAAPDEKVIKVEFPFTIKGDQTVTISDYDAPCSCLEARISDNGRLKWEPGEKGTVQGIFEMGNIKESVDKMIVLRLDGESSPSVKLTVHIEVPLVLEIEPKTLFWTQGEVAKPQTFKLKVHGDKALRILEVSGTNEDFPFELKTIKDGWEYEIVVTPRSLEERAFGLVRIKTDSEFERYARYQAFTVIRRGGPAAPKKE